MATLKHLLLAIAFFSNVAFAATVEMMAWKLFQGTGCQGTGAVAPFGFTDRCIDVSGNNSFGSVHLTCSTREFFPNSDNCSGEAHVEAISASVCHDGPMGRISAQMTCAEFTDPVRIDYRRQHNCSSSQLPPPNFSVYASTGVCSPRAAPEIGIASFLDSFFVARTVNGGYNVSYYTSIDCSGSPFRTFHVSSKVGFGHCVTQNENVSPSGRLLTVSSSEVDSITINNGSLDAGAPTSSPVSSARTTQAISLLVTFIVSLLILSLV